jgi:2'-5' RNA ligase
VATLLKSFSPLILNVTKYGFYPWKIAYLEIEVTPKLQKLHNELMETIQKHRTPMVIKTLLESKHFVGKQRLYIEKYGYQFAFEYYSPHFTVAGNDMSDSAFEMLKRELEEKKEGLVVTATKIVFMNREENNRPEIEIDL